jgi:hypothetical protein
VSVATFDLEMEALNHITKKCTFIEFTLEDVHPVAALLHENLATFVDPPVLTVEQAETVRTRD